MLKLVKNADVYAPEHIGRRDILISESKICAIRPDLSEYEGLADVETFDGEGLRAVPGFIDSHAHVAGGGGESGFTSRVPEAQLTDFTCAGITSVIGMLGTDSVTRSLENLYAKVCALNEEGITAYMLTGSYAHPSPTLTGDVTRDIVLIDRVLGVKLALSDHRSCEMTHHEFARACAQARRGGLFSGKAGVAVMHMGDGEEGLDHVFYALEHTEIPVKTFIPTHVNRSRKLFMQALRFNGLGGTIDLTAGIPQEGGAAKCIARALSEGADILRITLSSDAFGSQPRFDGEGRCIGLTYGTSATLIREIHNMVETEQIPLETALIPVTVAPALAYALSGKGRIEVGMDADIVFLDGNFTVRHTIAKGKIMLWMKEPIARGTFEEQWRSTASV